MSAQSGAPRNARGRSLCGFLHTGLLDGMDDRGRSLKPHVVRDARTCVKDDPDYEAVVCNIVSVELRQQSFNVLLRRVRTFD
jgi:hypothetical protein